MADRLPEPGSVINRLRTLAATLGRRPTWTEFGRASGLAHRRVVRLFGSYQALAAIAGLPRANRTKHDSVTLLRALRDACLAHGGVVSRAHIARKGSRNASAYVRRWGTWREVLVALRDWVEIHDPGFAWLVDLPQRGGSRPPTLLPRPAPAAYFGAPLNFRGLLHAPVNEAGVAMLFGILAPDLGFAVERVGVAFPDCEAKRRVAGGWQRTRIEFEFESRNFQLHGHDPAGCGLIVCWKHNWPGAPVEALELKTEVATRSAC